MKILKIGILVLILVSLISCNVNVLGPQSLAASLKNFDTGNGN